MCAERARESMVESGQYEDQAIRRVFAIALREQDADATANPPVICLQGLAEVIPGAPLLTNTPSISAETHEYLLQELLSEGKPLLCGKDTIDRAIMARLLDPPAEYPQWPLQYLIGCYARATAEIRALSALRDKDAANKVQQDLQYCKELIAANAGLLLTMSDSLFPQVR